MRRPSASVTSRRASGISGKSIKDRTRGCQVRTHRRRRIRSSSSATAATRQRPATSFEHAAGIGRGLRRPARGTARAGRAAPGRPARSGRSGAAGRRRLAHRIGRRRRRSDSRRSPCRRFRFRSCRHCIRCCTMLVSVETAALPFVTAAMISGRTTRHQDQHEPEGAHDRGAGRQIELQRQPDAERRHDGAHRPADRQPRADVLGVQHRRDRRDDQVAEHQQHAGDRDRRRHDEAERGIEQEVPQPDVAGRSASAVVVAHRDRQERLAEDVVKSADRRRRAAPSCQTSCHDTARMLPTSMSLRCSASERRLAHRQDRRRGGDRVADADDRFLRDARAGGCGSSEKIAAPMNVNARLIQ